MSVRNPSNSTELSAEERALFLSLLAEEEIAFTPVELIPKRTRADDAPLSFAQQRLWFMDQFIPNSSLYNVPIAVRLQGRLDVNALERSLNEIVKRHEVLRTTFSAVDEQPLQTINRYSPFLLPIIDLRKFPPAAREAHVRSLAAAEAQRPFDLSRDRLLRARLLRLGTFDHVVLLTMHHISSDGWSMSVLVKEVAALYRAYSHGHESPLAELPIQYADFAVWQRQWLQGEVLESQLAYWKQRLADAPPVLDLPVDRPRPLVQTHRGAMRSLRLSLALSTALTDLSQHQGVTLFMTLLAAFQILLARYTRQDDIMVATPVAGRNRAELEDLIGFFVNTLVLRTDLSGNPSFAELLRRVREVALEAYAHQDLPFERLVEELQPDRGLGSNTLFQVMMVLQNATTATLQLPELTLSLLDNECLTSRFDLTLYLGESSDGLSVSFEYSTDLFEPETVDRMLRHYEKLLASVTVDPERRLADLDLLTDVERDLMLVEWNDTAAAWDQHSFISLFERQVKQTPDALAVEFGDQQLSYRELNRRANQLAHHLRNHGVGPDTRAGLSLERSCEMVIAVLGVLKAGGCYVPLDPAYPTERLKFMIADAQCAMLLTRDTVTASLLASESDEDPQIQIDPENLAFLIYTSGSTGKPKGVAMTHRALSNLINWHSTEFREPARTLQFASFSFDVSFQEMFSTWCSGGTLLLVNEDLRRDPKAMRRYLADQQAERIFLPFVYLQHLAEAYAENGTPPASLQEIVALGERLEITTQIAGLCERTQCPLHNHYGPTETHVMVAHTLNGATDCWPRLPPIGRPISNTEVYILDHALQPVPIGVAGEVYLGGECLSRGYWQRPELTAERYVSNPFGDVPGTRLYRTGDLGRYLSSGEIEFLGRCDTQVKIRGYRVELGEIEATLRKHPRVLHAVVIDKDDRADYKRLIAYVVPKGDSAPASAELNEYLQTQLPDYMLPAVWVMLEELPLTASGKLHRSALPEPESARLDDGPALLAPRTVIEEMVAGIWEHVLGVGRVKRNDNFFWLGGHSLLATRVVSRIRDVFQVDVQVRSLFECPTVVELSEHVEGLIRTGGGMQAPALRPRANDEHLPLSYAQQRLWFLDQLLPGSNAYNLPYAMYLDGGVNIAALDQALSEVMRRHEILRTTFAVTEGDPKQVIRRAEPLSLPLVDLSELENPEIEADRLIHEDALRAFNLSSGPLLRLTLVRLNQQRHLLLANMHHIISDGWSIDLMLREVESLYESFSQGLTSPLAELQIQYADYALWQREWLQGDVLQEHTAYWKHELEGAPARLELDTDRPQPLLPALRGSAHCPVAFSAETASLLREFSRREGVTLFMTLMAGFHALMQRYTGQNDVVIGTAIAGRSRAEVEELIGFFVNMVPLRTTFDQATTFRELIEQVKKATLGAHAHQELPFSKLVEELQPERSLWSNPVFQVTFALQNTPGGKGFGVPGNMETKFDLEVYLHDAAEGISGSFVYRSEVFEREFIHRMVQRFQRLFDQALVQPEAALSSLSLLDEVEYRQVVHEWNDTAAAFPAKACIHQIFEQQVEQQPDAIALEFEQEQLSYRELNRRANLLAQQLRREGVGPEVSVGVMLPRSTEFIVTLLAVAKAGGVYVPINLSDPQKRIDFVLNDAGVRVLITAKQIASGSADENLTPVATPHNLAHVMYTSGSTGTPKGAGITHRNVVALMKGSYFSDLNADEICLQFAPISFDGSTFEIWSSLLNGARLVVFPPLMPSVTELVDFIKQNQVTRLFLTTGLFHQFVDAGVSNLGSVRQLLIGGDALSATHVDRALEQISNCRFVNGYGPTETTMMACCYQVGPERPSNSVPIGRPVSNTRVYVLNAMEPAGVGERGELFIGGAGVGRGYHNRPDLTAERFLPDPFAPGGRLYRTGDVARYLSDGDLKFLGRVDNQVKISGYRIELAEIEAALSAHPAVAAAVVLATEVGPGDKRLVAYVVPQLKSEPAASTEQLRRFLKERLPGYMVPAAIVTLDALPLTVNGKLDRAALPLPEFTSAVFRPPRTPQEEILCSLFAEVTGVAQVGLDDNFFELGGHSLLGTRLVSLVRATLDCELPLRTLFESPTVAQLSFRLREARQRRLPLQPQARPARLPLSYAQQRLWFLDQLEGATPEYNMPQALRLRGPLSPAALEQAINLIVARHESLRTHFTALDGEPIQLIAASLTITLPLEDLSELDEETKQARVRASLAHEAQQPFDLAHGPVFRVKLLKLADEEHVLLRTMHHIVSDGWSEEVFSRELVTLYEAVRAGAPDPLPPLTIQYADFALWQRQWLEAEVLNEGLAYWKQQLADLPQRLELPTDRPRPALQTFKAEAYQTRLSAKQTAALKQLSRSQQTTLYMTLLAGFTLLLQRYSGQEDIVVGSPIANRQEAQLEELIGFFVNMLCLRVHVEGTQTFAELLAEVRRTALAAYEHQDVPFERLVEELSPQRSLNTTPLFQVAFALQNAPRVTEGVEGLVVEQLFSNEMRVRYDLEIHAFEEHDHLELSWIYNRDLFDQWRIEQLAGHYLRLLEAVVTDPEQRVGEIELLGTDERHLILEQWNETAFDLLPSTFPDLFVTQVDKTPAAVAVVFEKESITYAELNARANQLAHYLIERGAGPGVRVAVCFQRRITALIGMLGVLKSGAAYVPLDPDSPWPRMAHILTEADVPIVLTHKDAKRESPDWLCLEDEWNLVAGYSRANPQREPARDDAAYVIYTSGSTGQPKGVIVTHSNLINYLQWVNTDLLREPTLLPATTQLTFDASLKQVLSPLLRGGTVWLLHEDLVAQPEQLLATLKSSTPAAVNCVPTLWQTVVGTAEAKPELVPRNLTHLIIGGEQLSHDLVARTFSLWPDLTIRNAYGPSEATANASAGLITADGVVHIGQPISNTQLYVLNEALQPAPIGVAGELYVGGAGVADGYLKRPDQTAAAFIPDLFGSRKGSKLYRTGDRVRWRVDGNLEFLGRVDEQVKLRGFRVEPGEIEATLRQHPSVREAVVLVREDQPDEKRLVAYVVPQPPSPEQQANLQEQTEQIEQWQALFDDLQTRTQPDLDPRFNIIGWDSSYTGEPIPVAQMQQWLDSTVARILALQPQHVLEIGCGTGLLLFRIAPHCQRYWGTDFSAATLAQVQHHVKEGDPQLPQVKLLPRTADNFAGFKGEAFDTVILNSVSQYFPSVDYLERVLRGAIAAVRDGGAIFIGDVRSLPLLPAFHATLVLSSAEARWSKTEFSQQLQKQLLREKELVLDPAFFTALAQQETRISRVEVQLKQGREHNELNQFRYDVVLHVGTDAGTDIDTPIEWLDWEQNELSLAKVKAILEQTKPVSLGIASVPNVRLKFANQILAWLNNERGTETVAELRQHLSQPPEREVDPDQVYALTNDLPYHVAVSWSEADNEGRFEVVFTRHGLKPTNYLKPPAKPRPLSAYANNPLQANRTRQVVVELRHHLKQRLPEYMVPSAFVVLDSLPLTTSGKIDRCALPPPESTRPELDKAYAAPRNPVEELLAELWANVLGLDRAGIYDNFFDLGGHSLLAVKIVSRVRESFNVELPVRSLFEFPTLCESAERIKELMRAPSHSNIPALLPRTAADELPLSYAQQRLWFIDQLLPGSNAYNLPAEMELDAGLNISALEQSLSEVIRRHEALRTTFTLSGRQPVQQIKPASVEQLPLVDLLNLSAPERETTLQRLRQEDALRPFDLAAGPLVRTRLIRVEKNRHVFLLNKHHIVSDGWSVGVLMHDMETLYKAFSRGSASPLPELKIQYADYALWQRDWLQGDLLQEEVNFWKQQLEGAPTLLELETDHPRQLLRTLRGTHCPVSFSKEVSHSLREFSRQEGATLFMTLMAGFHALLWRYTGQNDILVGTPTAGRSRIDLEPMIGFFVNMIPIRTRFREAPTFRQLVKQVRESAFVAYAHQDLPFDRLVEELQPKRAPGRNPIFQAILALQNDAPEMEMAKVSVPAGVPASADVKFDLEVHLRDTSSNVNGVFVYSPELFEPSLMARMVNHFQRLFEQALAQPDAALSSLSLLDEVEYRQVVQEWNDTAVAFPHTACTHHIFEHHVEQQPDAIALEFGDEQLSYRVLNQRANLLAQQLRREGVGPEVFVGVMLPRSAELIVAMLAVVKAGGAYVPINLNDPRKRIEFVLDDAGVKVLVTTKQIALDLTERDLTLLYVDTLRDEPVEDVKADLSSENLVYLMYTSGSTGTPKGVCITHRNVVALIKSGYFPDLSSQDSFLQFAPVSFDGSTFEIWGALLNGARLVVFPPLMPSVSELVDFIKQTQVTRMFLTTGLFHQVVDANVRSLGAVRQLLTGGDVLSATHVNRAADQMDEFSLVNIYGPTETTVMSCCYEVGPERPANSVPIGRPIPNTRIYVLNAMQPAGAGERGELFIGGAGVGRGYHNRPGLTAERYLPDPFGTSSGGRLYRTGDIARYLSNGDLKFLGRIDNQVKIRGYRIELAEIEAVLSQHPAVTTAAVVATEVGPGDKRVVAYIVENSNGGLPASTEDLKRYLAERLPNYMVPSTFVMLDALPLTPHGKLDRAALPAPQIALASDREYVAPRNDLQRQLVEIWEELFKFQPIGVRDNFFELGGHSLLMVMLVARVEERLGKRVVIADLFGDPTIERLSELIGHGKEKLFQPLLVSLQTQGCKPALFSPHAGRGHVWCYQDLARYTGEDQPFYGIQARQPETGLVTHTQIEAMAAEYVEAIRSFQRNGPYLLCGWSMGGVIAFEMARQLEQLGQQTALLALLDSHAPNGQPSNHHWAHLLLNFARDVGLTQEKLNFSGSAALSQVSQLREVWKEAKSNSLIPSDMTLLEFRKEFDVFKANANIATSYQPGDYAGRITLFRTENQSLTSTELLNGWDKLALGGVELHTVPGDHFSMVKEPHVKVLAEELRDCIRKAL